MKAFFILLIFVLIIGMFASGAIGNANLADGGQPQDLTGSSSSSSDINYDVFGGGSSSSASAGGTSGSSQSSSGVKNSPCGSTYTVKSGDTLSKIAQACQIALKDLLAANPSIQNANLITVGQKITIYKAGLTMVAGANTVARATVLAPATAAAKAAAVKNGKPSPTPVPGVVPGETVTVEVHGFPPNTEVQVGIGKVGAKPTVVQKGMTDDKGNYTASVSVPENARTKEKWTVTITIVGQPKMKVTSVPFSIGSK